VYSHLSKLCLTTLCLCFIPEQATAQFGNSPKILTQSTNANQLGIWPADLDGDGDADLLGAHLVSLIWYENDGAGNFSNDHEIMTADMVNSIGFLTGAFEDLNADGLPDLVFDRAWRKNLGNGQFAPQATILANTLATLCDVDSDGLPDAITLEYTKMHWQRNLGTGSFGARQTLRTVTGADVYNLNVDLNSDGKQDFIARHNNACFWYKNIGNNQFDTVQLLATFPGAVSVGDLDSNGQTDLLLGTGGNILWYEFDADGQRTLRQTLPQYYGGELSLGDLDADGDADLFAGSIGVAGSHRAKYFVFNAATGLFDPVPKNHNFYLQDHYYSDILDLNGDAKPDILVGDVGGGSQLGWLENLAPGSFSKFQNLNRKLALPYEIEIADLENDGDMDIFSVGIVLENLGGGQYAEKRGATPGTGSRSFSGDLDGDGVQDLALPLGDSISWRKGLGNGQFAAPKLLPGLVTSCKQVGGGDLDNDGDIDLFAANGTDAVVANARFYWFENDGAGNFTGHLLETGIQFCAAAFALDANEDGLLDMGLLFFNSYSPRVYLNLGGGNFAPPTGLFPAGTPSPGNVNQDLLTDLDGDGRLDYIYCTRQTSLTKVAWYQNLGAAGFSAEKSLATMAHQGSYAVPRFCVFDANLDGITDVVVSDNYWNRFLFVKGLGNSAFAAATTVYDEPNFGNFYGVAAHDVDGDGKLDLVYGSDTDYLYNFNGYNRLAWLKNLHPAPVPGLQTVFNSSSCHDNGTPLDATDDRQVLRFKVVSIGDAATSGQFVLFDDLTETALDTFAYGVLASYALPPGSAGLFYSSPYSFRDLANSGLRKNFYKTAIGNCSPDAPAAIGINFFKAGCDDSGTPADPTDDRVRFEMDAAMYNGSTDQYFYTLNSSLGLPANSFDESNLGFYRFPETFLLPEGSAAVPGQVTLTLRDQLDTSIVREQVFDNPGTCVSVPPPCPAEIIYTKQSQIDLFPLTYPTCRIIEGMVTLRQSALPGAVPIENLNGFANLEIIRGDLSIEGTQLQNMQGLQNLDSLGGDLYLFKNPQLQNLHGLNSLKSVSDNLTIYDAAALQALDGLDSLNHIGNSLHLEVLPVLKNLTALQNLTGIPGLLWLAGCDALASLAGLHHLTNVGSDGFFGQLAIANCPLLENLSGLENLKSVTSLLLQENAGLKNLSGLDSLDTIREDLRFFDNPILESLHALAGVESALQDAFIVRNNDALTTLNGIGNMDFSMLKNLELTESEALAGCAQPNICAYLDAGGMAEISANEFGCNSAGEVLAVCSSPLTALLGGGGDICLGESLDLTIFFTGAAPFTFALAENGVPQPPVTTSNNPHTVSVEPVSGTVFTLVSVSNTQGSGLAGGSTSVSVFPLPQAVIVAPDTICPGDTTLLTASGGTGFQWNTGQQTAQIEVQPAATTTYAVTVSDAYACTATATWTVVVKDCTSGTFSASSGVNFQVFPNPLPEGEALQILLENDFLGTVKVEILGLDGRVLQTVFEEKTTRTVGKVLNLAAVPNAFFVRVSDGQTSATRLVVKF